MNEQTMTTAAAALNVALGPDTARPIPATNTIVALADSADRDAVIATLQRLIPSAALRADPVMLWHGPDKILLGPGGALDVTRLVADNRSLDVRIRPGAGQPVRVVISWVDGPSADSVRAALTAVPDIGLDIDLVREDLDQLVEDVLVAVFEPVPPDRRPSSHPVLDRVAAVADGRDTYYELLALTTALARELHRCGADRAAHHAMLATMLELDDPEAVNAVMEDIAIRLKDGQMFPVRSIDDAAMLTALFTLACLLAQGLSPAGRHRTRKEFAL